MLEGSARAGIAAVIAMRRAIAEHRLGDAPLIHVEFKSHDSRPQFGSLNHGDCDATRQRTTISEVTRKPDAARTSQNRRDSP
jgi:hypothetical protein